VTESDSPVVPILNPMPDDKSSSRHSRNAPRTGSASARSLAASYGRTSVTPPAGPELSDVDLFLFNEGSHARLYNKLGCHLTPEGATFRVWAPNAEYASVVGDFNGWNPSSNPLNMRNSSGIWECFVAGVEAGVAYKFHLGIAKGATVEKADPFAFWAEDVDPRLRMERRGVDG
jgi:hypothetical protein